jgi:two-component system LytT family response regulator
MVRSKITAVAIDDEESALNLLSNILLTSFFEDIELINSTTDFDEGLEMVHRIKPDVVFLDIDIEINRSGFDFLSQMRANNIHSKVIFITAHEQFGVKALREDAFDYLVKPIDKDDLSLVLDRLKINTNKKERDFILINNKEALHKVFLEDILFISAEGSYTEFHLENKSRPLLTSYNLSVIEKEINSISSQFYRIHKSYVVNISKTTTIKKQLTSKKLILTNDAEIPISRSKYIEFLSIFTNL